MSNEQKRIGWIDEFKGFVLLLVCLFHVEQSFSNANMGMIHLSALRMSAFFFISGVLFSTRRFDSFKSFLVHKTKVLLWPYLALSLLFLAMDPVVYNFDLFPKAPRMTVLNNQPIITDTLDYIYWNLAKIFIAGKSSIGSGPLWFVFTLYSVSLIFYLVQNIASKIFIATNSRLPSFQLQNPLFTPGIVYISKKAKHPQHAWPLIFAKIFVGIIAVVGLIYGWLLYKNHLRMPLGIERDLTVLFFFSCGWLSKGLIKRPNHNAKALAAIATVSFIIYAIAEIPDPNFSIMNNDLGKSLPKFIISSIFGIIGLTATFILADKLPDIFPIRFIKGILRNISRNALVILAVHWYILLVLRLLFRSEINKPGIAYLSIAVVAAGVIATIPLFRCKLYKLLGKQPANVREALNIKE